VLGGEQHPVAGALRPLVGGGVALQGGRGIQLDVDDGLAARRHRHPLKAQQLRDGPVVRDIGGVQLDDGGPLAVARVAHPHLGCAFRGSTRRAARGSTRVAEVVRDQLVLERRVAEPVSEGERRDVAVGVELSLTPAAVVDDLRRGAIERRQVSRVGRDRERQPAGRLGRSGQHVGQRAAALHAAVPGHRQGRHPLRPALGQDRASPDQHDHRARVGGRHRFDEVDVRGAQRERSTVAPAHEARRQPNQTAQRTAQKARREGRAEHPQLHRLGEHRLAFVVLVEADDDDRHLGPGCRGRRRAGAPSRGDDDLHIRQGFA